VASTSITKRIFLAILGASLMGMMPVTIADATSPKSEAQNGTVVENHTQIANRPSRQAPNDVFHSRYLSLARRLHLL
jgi:hypothetical protein